MSTTLTLTLFNALIGTGEIPSWLEGTLIRNGPGITKVGEDEYNHIFDGLAVLHRLHIQNGKVIKFITNSQACETQN